VNDTNCRILESWSFRIWNWQRRCDVAVGNCTVPHEVEKFAMVTPAAPAKQGCCLLFYLSEHVGSDTSRSMVLPSLAQGTFLLPSGALREPSLCSQSVDGVCDTAVFCVLRPHLWYDIAHPAWVDPSTAKCANKFIFYFYLWWCI
jgi:hypothetical protein